MIMYSLCTKEGGATVAFKLWEFNFKITCTEDVEQCLFASVQSVY